MPPPALECGDLSPLSFSNNSDIQSGDKSPHSKAEFDLDGPASANEAVPTRTTQAFTLWFRTRDAYRRLPQAQQIVREFLASNPFSTLQIVLETAGPFPFDVFDGLRAACQRPENIYLDRFYEFTPGRPAGARRIVVVSPASTHEQFDRTWLRDAEDHCDFVRLEPATTLGQSLPVSG